MLRDELVALSSTPNRRYTIRDDIELDYNVIVIKCKTQAKLGYDHVWIRRQTFSRYGEQYLERLKQKFIEQGLTIKMLEFGDLIWEIKWEVEA